MARWHVLTVRFNAAQYRQLGRLMKKLNLDKANLLRLALTRLAEAEGVLHAEPEEGK